MLMGLSICATLGGTISYGYGSPPTTISSCRYRLAYHRDIRIRALYGGYDPIGSRYQVSLLFVGGLSTRLRSAADAILLLFRLRPISLRKRALPRSNEFPPSSLCSYFSRSETRFLLLLTVRFLRVTLANLTEAVTEMRETCKSSSNYRSMMNGYSCYLQHRRLRHVIILIIYIEC